MTTNPPNTPPAPVDMQAPPTPPIKSRLTPGMLAAAGIGLAIGVIATLGVQVGVSLIAGAQQDTRLVDADAQCAASSGVSVGDGGKSITIDHKGNKDASGASFGDVRCILNALNAPVSVFSHIDQTTSVDGRQTESWDGIKIEWSYHPDRGADMVIVLDPTKK